MFVSFSLRGILVNQLGTAKRIDHYKQQQLNVLLLVLFSQIPPRNLNNSLQETGDAFAICGFVQYSKIPNWDNLTSKNNLLQLILLPLSMCFAHE